MAFTARTAALGEQDAVLQERLDEVARQNGEAIHPIDKKNEHPMLSIGCLGEDEVALIHILYFFRFSCFKYLLLLLMSNKNQQAIWDSEGDRAIAGHDGLGDWKVPRWSWTSYVESIINDHYVIIENHQKIYDDLCTN